MTHEILLIEDDRLIGEGLLAGLRQQEFRVRWIQSGNAAFREIHNSEPDVVVLDLGLPDIDGTQILSRLRASGYVMPIIVLSARDALADRIKALDAGADDYAVKPFSTQELAARIRAVCRRNTGRASPVIENAGVTINVDSREVTNDGVPISLTAREFLILQALMTSAGKIVQVQHLNELFEQNGVEISSNSIQVHVHSLRKKLTDKAGTIRTVRGAGYVIRQLPS